jgi:ATP-dependent Clp protease ATP-binding subunit ClpC
MAVRIPSSARAILKWSFLSVLAIALVLLVRRQNIGYTLLGLSVVFFIGYVWAAWYLGGISKPMAQSHQGSTDFELDRSLSVDVAGRLKWPAKPRDVWEAIRGSWQAGFILNRLGLPVDVIQGTLSGDDPVQIWDKAISLHKDLDTQLIDANVLTAALILVTPNIEAALSKYRIGTTDVIAVAKWAERISAYSEKLKDPIYFGGIARDWASGYTPTLDRYAHNLSTEVEQGNYSLHSLVHHQAVEQIVTNFASGSRQGMALVGIPGVGKTSLVYALAEKLLQNQGVGELAYQQIVALNASMLIADSKQAGELEAKLITILNEALRAGNIIVFLDEAQLFFTRGTGSIDISKILLPILQQNKLRIILAMTPADWERIMATDGALTTSMSVVKVDEPSQDDTIMALQDKATVLEYQSNKFITYQAVVESYRVAKGYMHDEALPGGALRLLDGAVNYPEEANKVTASSVQIALEKTTGVKITQTTVSEKQQLLNLEQEIHKHMINQSRAVTVVSDALRRSRAGVGNASRPVGSFLFLGPTGVGKTELAKSLALAYYGGESTIIRLDMSEYQQVSDLERLLTAADSGSANGNPLAELRQRPFSVVLIDEIEKAHPDVLNLLLQVLDEGHLTDLSGRKVSFSDAIVIATTNAGAEEIRRHIEAGEDLQQFENALVDQLINSGQFKPELLNRFDEIVLFRPLNKQELAQVVRIMMDEVNATLANQKVTVVLSDEAVSWLVDNGYDPRLGARPMRRMIQRSVENIVAKRILSGEVKSGDTVSLNVAELKENSVS